MAHLITVALLLGLQRSATTTTTTTTTSNVVIYVNSVTGRDGGDVPAAGSSSSKPLQTLRAAQAAARRALRQSGAHQGVTVRVAPGVYAPLALSALDSGTHSGEVRYEGDLGAIISGGVTLPPSSAVPPSDPIFSRLPAATRAGTRRFNVSGIIKLTEAQTVSGSLQLSCSSGRTLDLAVWPSNGSWAHTGAVVGTNGFAYPADASLPAKAADINGLWIEGYFVFDWFDSRIPVTSVVSSNHTLYADTAAANYVKKNGHFNSEARFRFLNLPELLQRPGQYWLDGATSMLYVLDWNGGNDGTCVVAVAPTVLSVSNADYITFSGFIIESAQQAIVKITGSSYVSVTNCTVRTGLSGIEVTGGAHVAISGVEAMELGGQAISINSGDRARLLPGSHSVTNCTIHDYAKVIWCYHPGVKIAGVGHSVTHNEIYNAPHQGILVGGNDHHIAFNVFHDLLLQSFDSGAIYKSDRDWMTRGLVMDSNFFYNLGSTSPSDKCNPHTACCRHGIYMDATEHGFTATRNLFIQPPALRSSACNYGVFDNGGRNNVISKNLCVGYANCVRTSDYNLISTPVFSYQMVRNFELYKYQSPPYSNYPGLADLDSNISLPLKTNCSKREKCGSAPWFVEVTSNVAVNGTVKLTPYGPEISSVPQLPRFNFSHNANVSMAAAGFVATRPSLENCWGIKLDSPIFDAAPGFVQIQLALVGPPAYRAAYAARCGV